MKKIIQFTFFALFSFFFLQSNFAKNNDEIICNVDFTWQINEDGGFVQFQNISTTDDGISFFHTWTFGDTVGSSSNEENPQYSFPTPGVYEVCLESSNLTCSGGICYQVEVGSSGGDPLMITCPASETLTCFSEYNPNNAELPMISGGSCPQEPEFSDEINSEDSCDSQIIRTWTIFDDCTGMTETCVQVISIQDNVPPIILSCPADITVNGMMDDAGECSASVDLDSPVATDNCGNVTITSDYNGNGVFFPNSTTITWTAMDDCGNEAQCTTVITVLPCQEILTGLCGKPVVTCASGIGGGIVAAIKNTGDLSTLPYDVNSPFPVENSWTVNQLGEVFGIAIDASDNIYFASTTLFGPNSFGVNGVNVYKIDGSSLTFDPTFNVSLPNVSGPTRNTADHAPGLGNIAYDPFHNQLLVTNHEDGKIYRIDIATETVVGSIRPIGVDDGQPGFCPLGERLWGIQVRGTNATDVEVYYGVWRNDLFASNGQQNWIGSLSLDATGDFISSSIDNDRIQLPLLSPHAFSSPVSDIAFSEDGKTMLLAERSMNGDMKPQDASLAGGWAHASRLLRYELNGTTWSRHAQNISIGLSNGTNSAGGTDFGYDYPKIQPCEAMIYGTGDYLKYSSGNRIYGLQVFDKTFPVASTTNSYLFDFDGNINSATKSQIGEVEVFKCTNCAPTNCEGLSATNNQNSDDCCYDLSFTNTAGYNITSAKIIVNTPDWVINKGLINPIWTYGASGGQTTEILTNGGIPATPTFAFDYCLAATTATAANNQEIIIEFYETINDTLLLCRDTFYTECINNFPPEESCVTVSNLEIACSPDDAHIYCLTFDVNNISSPAFDAWQITLSNLPPGFGFYDCNATPSYNDPINLQPNPLPISSGGTTSTPMCVKLISANDILNPVNISFNVGLEGLDSCCTNVALVPVTLTPCCNPCEDVSVHADDAVFGDDSMQNCCYDIDLINECEYNYFTKVKFDILTPGVVFSSHFNNDPINWQVLGAGLQDVTLAPVTPFVQKGTYNDFFTFCLGDIDDPSETPQQVRISYFTLDQMGQDSIACDTILTFECEPIEQACAFITNPIITCDTVDQKYTLTVTVDNNSVPSFKATDLNIISTQPGVIISPNPIPLGCLGPNDSPVTVMTYIYTNPWEDPDGLLPIVWRLKTANGDSCCNGGQIFYDTLALPDCYPPICCHENEDDFISTINGAISISTDECKGIVNISELPDCDAITSIDWGNGSITSAPISTPGMYMENYTTGAYVITINAVAYDANGEICYEQAFSFDIDIECCNSEPVFDNCPDTDIVLNANNNCENDTDINLTASHPCDDVTLTITCIRSDGAAINAPWPLGITSVTCSAMDSNGVTVTCIFNVIVQDIEPPVIDCPDDRVYVAAGQTGGNVPFFPPFATDNCGVQSLSCDFESGDFFDCGVHTVTCTAVDIAGNTADCTFEITVICDPCSYVDATSSETSDCCYEIDLINNYNLTGGTITNVNLELITPGVVFNIGTLAPGLNFDCPPTGQLICISDNGTLPTGNINDAIDFCFTNITNTSQMPQEVVISWYENIVGLSDSVLVCQDTLIFDCPIDVGGGGDCWEVDSLSVDCNSLNDTHYDFTFDVFNNSNFTAQSVIFYNLTTGYSFDDAGIPTSIISVNLPTAIAPGSSGIATVTIISPTVLSSPIGVCFDATLSGILPNGQWECCSESEQICITLEPCCDICEESSAILMTDLDEDCCHEVSIVNECQEAQFTKVELAILTPGVIFGSHFTGGTNPTDWSNPLSTPVRIQWQYDPTGIIPQGTQLSLMNFCLDEITDASQNPQMIEVRWFTNGAAGETIACIDTLITNCEPEVDYSCTTLKSADFDCQEDGSFDMVFSVQNSSYPAHAADFLDIQVVSPAGATISPTGLVFSPSLQSDSCASGTVNITGVNSGDNLVLIMRLRDLLTGDSWCCYEGDTLNLIIPECCIDPCEEIGVFATGGTDEECCVSMDVVNDCSSKIYQRIETEILNTGITFSNVNTGTNTDWSATTISSTLIHWTPNSGIIGAGTMDSLLNFCLDNPDFDTVQTVEIRWIDNNGDVACTQIETFSCPVSSCHEDQLIIPQGFTPNNDGFNPIFTITSLNLFCQEVDLVVYNRWGNIVYQENNFDNNWNGDSNNGQPLPDGTYYLIIELKDSNEQFARFIDIRR